MSMSKRILIVEEHCDLLNLLGEALALLGWEPILAENIREAMNELEKELPSVVLLDMRTPVIDGVELAESLKAHPVYKNIPILAAGGYYSGLTREQCLSGGCDDFIAKPSPKMPSTGLGRPSMAAAATRCVAARGYHRGFPAALSCAASAEPRSRRT